MEVRVCGVDSLYLYLGSRDQLGLPGLHTEHFTSSHCTPPPFYFKIVFVSFLAHFGLSHFTLSFSEMD